MQVEANTRHGMLNMIIAHHFILTGYGHWLPNDPRGSMSRQTLSAKLAPLGNGHCGRRKPQPSRQELKQFHRRAGELLDHAVLWFEDAERQALTDALGQVVRFEGLTCYACAVVSSHVHILVRKHRLKGEEMLSLLKEAGRRALHQRGRFPADHPVFSTDSCDVYKSDPQAVRNCIAYISDQYRKHGLTPMACDFISPYDDWPFHKQKKK